MTVTGQAEPILPEVTPAKKLAAIVALTLTGTGLIAGLLWGFPFLVWAYNVHQAGTHMERGMAWPEERHSDSLPQALDITALETALTFLDKAQAARPQHFHAFRLEGQIFMALDAWLQVEPAIAAAIARAPGNPLVHFDHVIVYEQMMQALAADAGHQLWPQVRAQPGLLVHPAYSEVCTDPQEPALCPYLYTRLSLPVAGALWEAPFLGFKGSQDMEAILALPPDAEALAYLLAVWPQPGEELTGSLSAQLQIRGEGDKDFTTLSSHDLSAADHQGVWLPGVVSLAPWTGQTVTFRWETRSPGHIIGWGQMTLATAEISGMTARTPRLRWGQALWAGGFDSRDTRALAAEAENIGQAEQHAAWLRRSELLESLGR